MCLHIGLNGKFGGEKAFVHNYALKVEEKWEKNEDRERWRLQRKMKASSIAILPL